MIYFLSNLSRTTPAICHLSPVKSVISPNVNMGSLGLGGEEWPDPEPKFGREMDLSCALALTCDSKELDEVPN